MIFIQKHLEFYCRQEQALTGDGTIADFPDANAITDWFKTTEKITDQTGEQGTKTVEIMVPLQYLSNFLRTLEYL